MVKGYFLDERRLLRGPWKAFERDVGRLLLANGFGDVRIVGGRGDHGADVLGVKNEELWVFQCKFTSAQSPPKTAVDEVIEAGRFYGGDKLFVATSRPPGEGLIHARNSLIKRGLNVGLLGPSQLLSMMKACPEYSPSRRLLRDYQEDASTRFREGLLDTGRAQIVMATGLGKTLVMSEVLADLFRDGLIKENRVLVLAHTNPLVDQLEKSFWYQLPTWIPTHRLAEGELPSFFEGVTFGTFQSVLSRMEELPEFGLVLVDEAHHIGATTFREVIDRLASPMLGGVTATPWRGDGYDIDTLLGEPIVRLGISDGLMNGWLSDVDYRLLGDNLDWEFIQKSSRHKYSITQLNRKLLIPIRDEKACQIIRQQYDSQKRNSVIVFSPTIIHAKSFAAMLKQFNFKAEAIHSNLHARERDRLLSRFQKGELQVLTTVDLFNEGVDVPDVDMIVFLRNTHSRRIFVQQLGRGLRTSPHKSSVLVLDFVSDLRRIAEVVDLDAAMQGGPIERLGLGSRLVAFSDNSAGSFLREWMLDQADLLKRENDPQLEVPALNFPDPEAPGSVN